MFDFFRKPYQSITSAEAASRRSEGWSPFVLDVRPEAEATAVGQVPGTDRRHEHQRIQEIAAELPRDRDLLVYCKAGGRSGKACTALARAGFEEARLFNLADGIDGWHRHVDPGQPG